MENTGNNQEEHKKGLGTLEICIDHEHVTVSLERFTELVKKEEQLAIVSRVYFTKESYNMGDALSILFGPKPDKKSEGTLD
ncbi:MAG: hypothetical protein K0R50_434 [Eubacterium sp.]|jgi:hypothetical protein|nr:hypothetical protein [Eubacterium sp.]